MADLPLTLLAVTAAASLGALVVALLALLRQGAGADGARLARLEEGVARLERLLREELSRGREEGAAAGRELRGEMGEQMARLARMLARQAGEQGNAQREQVRTFAAESRAADAQALDLQRTGQESLTRRLADMAEANGRAGEALRAAVEAQLAALRRENGEKLEAMRTTVDEKLQGTLEQRLGESFRLVSERLEAVHQGLGEMQGLASGVGDLKRVLTNVKSRGSWGEVQLGALLEQVLTPAQYLANAAPSPLSSERVEYAIRLPGGTSGEEVLLPIDAKFPVEDYERLQAAADTGDVKGVEAAGAALEARIRQSAREIAEKYVLPPRTTDFAILFLPTEGLYAEVIRRPGLCDALQRTHRVVIAGPTTLTALLNSLQMGFRTLAIQERSSEVWQVLAAVKTEFGKFGPVLEKVKKKLQEATNHIDGAEVRGRAIARSLRQVEAGPSTLVAERFEEELLAHEEE